jgi:NAD(P)-dependent dehydrogenase (short-subunit alcohol dehydrogenase family)
MDAVPVVAAITGASGGIGRAIALELAAAGATVAVASRNEVEGLATVEQVESAGGTALFTRVDVRSAEQVGAWINGIQERFGRLDWLVNNAGISGGWIRLEDQSTADFDAIIATNLLSACYAVHAAVPLMRAQGSGAIVNVGSTASLQGYQMMCVYVASKHALLGLTRSLALENADIPIRVNCVCPGLVDTSLMRDIEAIVSPDDPAAALQAFAGTVPLKRYATPEEVAKVTRFLLGEESAYITGAAVSVDGGVTVGV